MELNETNPEPYMYFSNRLIEEKKILDAVAMLQKGKEKTGDKEISALLDELLEPPAAPGVGLQPGIYEEEKQLTLSCDTPDAVIYYTLDGKEPTKNSTPYSGSIALKEGKNIIKAVSISNAQVASEISEYRFDVRFPGYVYFEDPAFEAFVRKLIKKTEGRIKPEDLKNVSSIWIYGNNLVTEENMVKGKDGGVIGYNGENGQFYEFHEYDEKGEIYTLVDLQLLPALKDVRIHFNPIQNLNGLENPNKLRLIDLSANSISDISVISKWNKNIEHLNFSENKLVDVSVFKDITFRIDSIGLSFNQITDISPLKNIKTDSLYLYGNPISNTDIIQELRNRGIQVIFQ